MLWVEIHVCRRLCPCRSRQFNWNLLAFRVKNIIFEQKHSNGFENGSFFYSWWARGGGRKWTGKDSLPNQFESKIKHWIRSLRKMSGLLSFWRAGSVIEPSNKIIFLFCFENWPIQWETSNHSGKTFSRLECITTKRNLNECQSARLDSQNRRIVNP